MSLQTRKSFVHLRNKFFLFFMKSENFSNGTTMFKAQKSSKDIVKMVHVTSVVQ